MKINRQAAYNLITPSKCLGNCQNGFKVLQSSYATLRTSFVLAHWVRCSFSIFCIFPLNTCSRTLPSLLKSPAPSLTYKPFMAEMSCLFLYSLASTGDLDKLLLNWSKLFISRPELKDPLKPSPCWLTEGSIMTCV